MKVLLVQPRLYDNEVSIRNIICFTPLNLEILAANIPDREVDFIDLRIEDDLAERLESFRPDVVGVTSWTQDLYNARLILEAVKAFDPAIRTVVGGIHATLNPHDFRIDTVDAVVIGEGEITFPELLQAFEGSRKLESVKGISYRSEEGWRTTAPRELIADLDEFPFPDRSLSEPYRDDYMIVLRRDFDVVETGRGCLYKCKFCSVWKQNRGTYRQYGIDRLLGLVEATKAGFVGFTDDNFFQNPRHSEAFCDALLASGIRKEYLAQARTDVIARKPEMIEQWQRAGLSCYFLGVEAVTDRHLETLNKKTSPENHSRAFEVLRANGIKFLANIMVDPGFSEKDFRDVADFVERHRLYGSFAITTPYPGTDLFDERTGDILTRDYRLYDCLHAVMRTRLPRVDFYKRFAALYKNSARMMHPFYDPGAIETFLRDSDQEEIMNFILYTKNWKRYKCYLRDEERIAGAILP